MNDEEMKNIIIQAMNYYKIPGCIIAVFNKNRTLEKYSLGYNSLENSEVMPYDVEFGMGSCAKSFTSSLCLKLADEGVIDLHQPIKKYVPKFSLSLSSESETITIWDVLSNKTCLGKYYFLWDYYTGNKKELLELLPKLECFRVYDHRMNYNNLFYSILEYILEEITGTDYDELLDSFLRDLSLKNTYRDTQTWKKSAKRLYSYNYYDDRYHLFEYPKEEHRKIGPDLFMNMNDLIMWIRFHMSEGIINGQPHINKESMFQMHSPQTIINPKIERMIYPERKYLFYGLGWFIQQYRGINLNYHEGKIYGGNVYMGFVPGEDIGIAMVFNNYNDVFANIITYSILDKYLYGDRIDWLSRYINTPASRYKMPCVLPYCQKEMIDEKKYVGRYVNPIFEDIRISFSDGLIFSYVDFRGFLQYQNDENFLVRAIAEYNNIRGIIGYDNSIKVRFSPGAKAMYIFNESNLDEIEYLRVDE